MLSCTLYGSVCNCFTFLDDIFSTSLYFSQRVTLERIESKLLLYDLFLRKVEFHQKFKSYITFKFKFHF